MNLIDIQHLYWRAGFGLTPKEALRLLHKDKKAIIHELFTSSSRLGTLKLDLSEFEKINYFELPKDKKEFLRVQIRSQEKLSELNFTWVNQMFKSNSCLRERMTLFWTNHFVCREENVVLAIKYHNLLRKNALGNFRDFLKLVSKEPAMIRYLNLNRNYKNKPNENFARELMELFSLGEGNYSEEDIKESSRAFTGYDHNHSEGFVFKKSRHDYGVKRFLGKTGGFTGDDIIDIILEQKQCARFVCEKIYKYFVNEKLNQKNIGDMIEVFYKNYDISLLMQFVFSSKWFYKEENVGVKIKSPLDLLVGLYKVIPFNFTRQIDAIKYQRLLGQVLFKPRNVSGWKGGKTWIDSKTIFSRLTLPSILFSNSRVPLNKDVDVNEKPRKIMGENGSSYILFKNTHDWSVFDSQFKEVEINQIKNYLLVCNLQDNSKTILKNLKRVSKRQYAIQLMSIPEYQMC